MQLWPELLSLLVAMCSAWYWMSASDQSPGTTMSGEMPPSYFTLLHPNAALTDAEKQQLIDGMTRTVQAK
mgnify:CR=1 FL=1